MPNRWRDSVLAAGGSVADAIRVIETGGTQICLIVGGDGTLLGTVTDGDVRRGILKGIGLNAQVSLVMNARPRTVAAEADPGVVRELMDALLLRQIPIVDGAGRLIGLVTDHDLKGGTGARDNIVVLMAGGLGNRLRPLTEDTPKPLLKVGRKPLLQTILETFLACQFNRFYIAVNYKAEMIKSAFGDGAKWNCEIRYLEEEARLGTAGALAMLPERPAQPLVVMNGDVLTKVNFGALVDFHTEHGAIGTMCVREYDFQVPYGVVKIQDGRIASIQEKPVQSFFVNAGIYALAPEALDLIPRGAHHDMTDLFATLVARNSPTAVFPIREYWMDIGQLADFERANGEFAAMFE